MLYGMSLPAAKDRFMPKKHGPLLSRLVTEAWTARNDALASQKETLAVAETLAAYLERKNPPDDMAVLRRYGKTQTVDDAYCRVWSAGVSRWDQSVLIDLPRKIEVAGGANHVYIDGSHNDDAPVSVESYFFAIVEARDAYRAEYKESTLWPFAIKKELGVYPTWGEIESGFPVLGAWIAAKRVENQDGTPPLG